MNSNEIRCGKCFCELKTTSYSCGIFVEQCDCDDSEDAIRERIEKEYNLDTNEVYDDGHKDGHEEGLVIGFKNGIKNERDHIIQYLSGIKR